MAGILADWLNRGQWGAQLPILLEGPTEQTSQGDIAMLPIFYGVQAALHLTCIIISHNTCNRTGLGSLASHCTDEKTEARGAEVPCAPGPGTVLMSKSTLRTAVLYGLPQFGQIPAWAHSSGLG